MLGISDKRNVVYILASDFICFFVVLLSVAFIAENWGKVWRFHSLLPSIEASVKMGVDRAWAETEAWNKDKRKGRKWVLRLPDFEKE